MLDSCDQSISDFTAHIPATSFDPEQDLVVCCERRTNDDIVLQLAAKKANQFLTKAENQKVPSLSQAQSVDTTLIALRRRGVT